MTDKVAQKTISRSSEDVIAMPSPIFVGASDAMRAFVAVVDAGGFARAAEVLDMTPSAVSKVISRLETRLGTRLLTRTTRRIALTEAGAVFLKHAYITLEAIETAVAGVTALEGSASGVVRVSVGSAYAKHQLVPRLPAFHAHHPDIVVELNITDALVDLRNEGIDIAIRPRGERTSDLHATTVGLARRHLCATPTYLKQRGIPKAPKDLDRHYCLVMNGAGFDRWPFRYNGRIQEVTVSGPVRADNADMLLDLALADHGIVRLLDTIVGSPMAEGRLLSILQETHVADSRHIEALVRRGREVVPRIDAFLSFLRN